MPSNEEIAGQLELLAVNRRTLALLLRQERLQGGRAYALPAVVNGILEARAEIARITAALKGWGVEVELHPDDIGAPEAEVPGAQPPQPHGGIHIYGGTFNAPVGQSGGSSTSSVYSIAGSLNIGASPGKDEFLAALRQFKAELAKASDLPADKADEIGEDVDSAIKALDRPQPNVARAGERLENVRAMLETTLSALPSALALGTLIGQVLAKLPGLGG